MLPWICTIATYSQNSAGLGTRLNISDKQYHLENYTNQINIAYKNPTLEILGFNSIQSQNNSSKFSVGYTFEVGLTFHKFTKKETNISNNSIYVSDTIGYRLTEDFKVKKNTCYKLY